MRSTGDHGARPVSRHLKVLMPSSTQKLRITGDLAQRLEGDVGSGGTAVLVSPLGSKVWRVEVGRDGNIAFLGRGWPEFAAAHGISDFWFLVFRNEGAVLTVKVFDTSCCLREFACPLIAPVSRSDTAGRSRRPQFIKVLLGGSMERMVIPPEFVWNHITAAEMNNRPAALLSLCGKYWHVKVEKDRSGKAYFSGAWSQFLASNGIIEGEALLLRYEGNLVFTVKAFGLNGCQKSFKSTKMSGLQEIEQRGHPMKFEVGDEDAHSLSTGKRKIRNEAPTIAETKRPARSSATPSNKGSRAARKSFCTYDIGPPSWMKKEINTYAREYRLLLAPRFCKAIGFLESCEITLRTTLTNNGATKSWQVCGCVYPKSGQYQLEKGWTAFCQENGLKDGDVCTFNIKKATLWHVDITRRSS